MYISMKDRMYGINGCMYATIIKMCIRTKIKPPNGHIYNDLGNSIR